MKTWSRHEPPSVSVYASCSAVFSAVHRRGHDGQDLIRVKGRALFRAALRGGPSVVDPVHGGVVVLGHAVGSRFSSLPEGGVAPGECRVW